MNNYTILHIHSDPKFIYLVNDYDSDYFTNTVIFIGDRTKVDAYENIKIFDKTKDNIAIIRSLCNAHDAVVIYYLDNYKSYIINSIRSNICIIWRFFGADFYNFVQNEHLSELTQKYILEDYKLISFKLQKFISKLNYVISWRKINRFERQKALKRIDHVIMISKSEYKYVKELCPNFPSFIQCSYEHHYPQIIPQASGKSKSLIIGHSRSKFNNHLDVINLCKASDLNDIYLIFLFNYGDQNKYTAAVKDEAEQLPNVSFIEEYLNMDDFILIYREASALVLNSYRQLGGANIMYALKNGLKIYLNNKNIHSKFLKDEGFLIFDINNLKSDINKKNISLNQEDIVRNINTLKTLTLFHTKANFNTSILTSIKIKKNQLEA